MGISEKLLADDSLAARVDRALLFLCRIGECDESAHSSHSGRDHSGHGNGPNDFGKLLRVVGQFVDFECNNQDRSMKIVYLVVQERLL